MHVHILHTQNRVFQAKHTINNQRHGKNSHGAKPQTSLAQATGSRLGETANREPLQDPRVLA